MNILSRLQQQKDFNPSEKQIAEQILLNPEKILTQSIQELALQTYTSTSSIVRLCRKIGLKGFKDFKMQLASQLHYQPHDVLLVDPDFPFSEDDTYTDITDKLKELSIHSINQTAQLFSDESLESSVKLITQAVHVGIFAYGDTAIPALNFQNKMMKIGHHILSSHIPGEDHHLANSFNESDCAILLSYSGESKNNYHIAKILKQRGVPLIVVTAYPNSHIGLLADVLLLTAVNESKNVKLSTFSSQLSMDYLLNVSG
ncbi:MurR/RpiR family transcriptional regulator [Enterococcus eurekensis]|uniref:MurR/RpiR family transcriptional regulator n=1 Tax=Enterococcus eurekensis TaxID=1159753 RepID=A0ABV9M728_9ENTE